jgi:glycosyltransferase involved in cell wall biosynthesis
MSFRSPRVLYVAHVPPDGESGARVRCRQVLRALQEIGKVEMVFLNLEMRNLFSVGKPGCILAHEFAVQQPSIGIAGKIRRSLDPRTDYPNGWGVGQDALRRVHHSLEQFDLIWFFNSSTADMFPDCAWPRSVVDVDDIPSSYFRTSLRLKNGLVHNVNALRRLFLWQRREKRFGDRFTVLTVCSEEDKQYLTRMGVTAPIHVVPNGFERPRVEPLRDPAIPPRVGFIGTFEYSPNREGIEWFVRECWPRIKRQVPGARLRLVGSGSDDIHLKAAGSDIDGLGWVPDPTEELQTWSVMVVPILSGAGTRVKIAHGLSRKCPIVSTGLGAFGYGVEDGCEMYIRDSASSFADACVSALTRPEEAAQMAERGWSRFVESWTWEATRPLVWAAAEDCLRRNSR